MATLKSLVDETTNIKNELKTCHSNLKNNLISKDVECSDNDKLSSLINKIPSLRILSSYPVAGDNYVLYSQGSSDTNSKTFIEYGRYQHTLENGSVRVNITFKSSSSQTSYVRIKVLRGSSEIFTNDYDNSGVNTGSSITITQDIDIQKNDIVTIYYKTANYKVTISNFQVKCSYPIL